MKPYQIRSLIFSVGIITVIIALFSVEKLSWAVYGFSLAIGAMMCNYIFMDMAHFELHRKLDEIQKLLQQQEASRQGDKD